MNPKIKRMSSQLVVSQDQREHSAADLPRTIQHRWQFFLLKKPFARTIVLWNQFQHWWQNTTLVFLLKKPFPRTIVLWQCFANLLSIIQNVPARTNQPQKSQIFAKWESVLVTLRFVCLLCLCFCACACLCACACDTQCACACVCVLVTLRLFLCACVCVLVCLWHPGCACACDTQCACACDTEVVFVCLWHWDWKGLWCTILTKYLGVGGPRLHWSEVSIIVFALKSQTIPWSGSAAQMSMLCDATTNLPLTSMSTSSRKGSWSRKQETRKLKN